MVRFLSNLLIKKIIKISLEIITLEYNHKNVLKINFQYYDSKNNKRKKAN